MHLRSRHRLLAVEMQKVVCVVVDSFVANRQVGLGVSKGSMYVVFDLDELTDIYTVSMVLVGHVINDVRLTLGVRHSFFFSNLLAELNSQRSTLERRWGSEMVDICRHVCVISVWHCRGRLDRWHIWTTKKASRARSHLDKCRILPTTIEQVMMYSILSLFDVWRFIFERHFRSGDLCETTIYL